MKYVFGRVDTIEKLFALVMVAFIWAYLVGIHIHENVKQIRLLKNGYNAKSLFKYGLGYIATTLLNAHHQNDIDIFDFLSCT